MLSDNEDLDQECEVNYIRDRDGDIYENNVNNNKLSHVKSLNEYNSPKQTNKQSNFTNEQLHLNTSNGYTELFINNNDDDLAVKNLNLIIEQNDDILPTRSKLSELMRSVSPGVQSSSNNKFFKSHSSGFGMSDHKSTSVN